MILLRIESVKFNTAQFGNECPYLNEKSCIISFSEIEKYALALLEFCVKVHI